MTEPNTNRVVSVVGLGNMGAALADALLADRHRVAVWNRTLARCEPLQASGAEVASKLTDAVEVADVIVVCLLDDAATRSAFESGDALRRLRGKTLVQLSTITAEESRTFAELAAQHGCDYLDGSILGYPEMIRAGEGTIVYSGSAGVFEDCRTVLESLSGKTQLVSENVGAAPIFDKALYAWHYGSTLAFLHGAAICHAAGFDIGVYADEIASRDPARPTRSREFIARRQYDDPGCALEVEAAAYDHVLRVSEELGIDTELARTVKDYFERAIEQGHGAQETAAIFEILLKNNA